MTEKRFDVVMNEFDEVEYITDIVDYEDRDFADFIEFANEMAKENEKLKQAIVETEKLIQSTYDELTKLRCFKKNILRIKHSWDYLMEAIQYD